MHDPLKPNAARFDRLRVAIFTVVLGVLVFRLLGFVTADIGSITGPQLGDFEKKYVEPSTASAVADSEKQLRDIGYALDDDRERQRGLRESADRFAKTIDELRAWQNSEKAAPFGESEQKRIAETTELFLYNQKRDQEIGENAAELIEQRATLTEKKRVDSETLAQQQAAAHRKFETARSEHEWMVAGTKVGFYVALFALMALIFSKMDAPLESPAFCATGVAMLARMVFDSRHLPGWQRYILPLIVFVIVARVLMRLVDAARYPKGDALLRQRSESYAAGRCPSCNTPFGSTNDSEKPENCATCGARLFEECPKCKAPRHTLLPFCEHCGADRRRA